MSADALPDHSAGQVDERCWELATKADRLAGEVERLREFAEYAKATFHALEWPEGYEQARSVLAPASDEQERST